MRLTSKYVGIGWLTAAAAMSCGESDGTALQSSVTRGGGAGSPNAPAGASSTASQGIGGAGSGSNSEGQPNVAGGLAGANGGGAENSGMGNAGGPNTSACTASACPELDVNADGALEPGCCTMGGGCGGQIEVMGTTFCAPAGGGIQFDPEPIVPDPRCLEQTLANPQAGGSFTLPGCCDGSGVCGVSTGGAVGDAGAGVPIACLTPADLAEFGVAGDAGTFAEVSCQ